MEHGSRRRRWVALTFDADMTYRMLGELHVGRVRTWVNGALFAELRATHTPATIFLTGLWTRTNPTVVRRLAQDPSSSSRTTRVITPAWKSPCYGQPTVLTRAPRPPSLQPVDGGVDSRDAFSSDTAAIVTQVLDHVRPGRSSSPTASVRPNAPATAAAMRQSILKLRARRYQLVTLDRLIPG